MYEALMAGRVKGNISHESLVYLSQWLECRGYVLPAERLSEGPLISYALDISSDFLTCKADTLNLYLLLDDIETSLSLQSQENIISWIRDFNSSAIHLF